MRHMSVNTGKSIIHFKWVSCILCALKFQQAFKTKDLKISAWEWQEGEGIGQNISILSRKWKSGGGLVSD